MTSRLYYKDPYIKNFITTVLKQDQELETNRRYVVLKDTAFYPTGGGQPSDRGTIQNRLVTGVENVNDEIRHYIESPLEMEENKEVTCQVDWTRRFDHMQQHTGQHILSAAFVELWDVDTVGFHLGEEISTIDLKVDALLEEDLLKGEELANKIILENRPIETTWVSADELSNYPLRKKPKVSDNIRLVIIPQFDYNGCGGTHPNSTGEVSTIKVLSWERMRGNIRIQFVCGDRVRKVLGRKHQVLQRLTDLLNTPEEELHISVERLLGKEKELIKNIEEKVESLLEYEARELLMNKTNYNVNPKEATSITSLETNTKLIELPFQVINHTFHNRPIKELQKMAKIMLQRGDRMVILLVNETEDKQIQFFCTRDKKTELNLKKLAPKLLSLINGKGGGKETQIQGGGNGDISGEEFMKKALEQITEILGNQ
ncbi:alanyl-tRNA editing protein [Evansella tamaricis]|uniref:Alanyl-tRNA editing protein n=1 Tax=Evansella tamaricis TaxID=2069301 RepID=A0ABS6JJS3_9BACI|nr:alanine--tRNA ligase-related protein [Evansella tamaricis]MBU9712700.1 alanyl-tRNA editing protein [Evansella tamaricis]